jgi:hypothetical protein
MNPDTILGYCDEIDVLTQKIRDELGSEPPDPGPEDETVINNCGDVQATLTAGGNVALAPNLVCEGSYSFDTPDTKLRGQGGNKITGSGNPALRVSVGINHIGIEALEGASNYDSVIRVGKNDTNQTTVDQAPDDVKIEGVRVATHRGKRGIEINAANVTVKDCDIRDVYSSAKQDSQAIAILNAPGPVLISGGYFEAASENIMVGGDKMKIPNCRPTGITIEDAVFTKPIAWKGNSSIPTKNLLELKDGHNVTIRRCTLTNSWASGQDGYGFMFTPKNGGSLRNLVVENCTMSEVGAIVNITGHDFTADNASSLPRTTAEMRGGSYRTNKTVMGGPGRFCLITEGPESVVFRGMTIEHEGSSFVDYADKASCDILHILDCTWNYGSYGIRIGGANHGDNAAGVIKDLVITGNTIRGAHSQFKSRYPDNIYIDAMSAEREREVDRKDIVQAVQRELNEELKRLKARLRSDV